MAKNIGSIPPNAVELLFVEDLMQYLLNRKAGIHYQTDKAGPYRNFILNVFNTDVEIAVHFIDISVENEIVEHFCELVEISEKSFMDYALQCEDICFKKGFQAECFLEYCVRLVIMAVQFASHNVPETINITPKIILKLLEDRGGFEEGWDTVIEAARKYARIHTDCCNVMTPDTSDDEHVLRVSDHEPSRYNSEDKPRAYSSEDKPPAYNSEDKPPAYSSGDEPPAYSSEDEPPAYSSEDEPPAYSSEDEPPAHRSADSLDMNEEIKECDYVSNKEQLHKAEREFESDDLTAARKSLQSERSSKSATNVDFNSGQTLEGTSSTYKLLPSPPQKSNMSFYVK